MRSSKFANLRQVLTLAIAMIDREYQEREEHPPNRVSHFFTFIPTHTRLVDMPSACARLVTPWVVLFIFAAMR